MSDPRMTGLPRRHLLIVKKLSREKVYRSVILDTTNWSKVRPKEGARREKELIETDKKLGINVQERKHSLPLR
jgi:hypothetical protein